MRLLYLFFLISIVYNPAIFAQHNKTGEFIATNNLLMWIDSFGRGSRNPESDDAGLYFNYQNNHQLTSVYADGPIFGFKLQDSLHVHASMYYGGFKPHYFGNLKNDTINSISKVMRNWELMEQGVDRDFYEFHHNNYPVSIGAPYIDNNLNGMFDPRDDTPRYRGDKMLWWKNYTNDQAKASRVFPTPPAELEVQTTVWVESEKFADVVYKQYLFINNEPDTMKDFHFGYFSDADLGKPSDDYAGCDTTLGLFYAYNGEEIDTWWDTLTVATGYLMLDGPVIKATSTDTSRYNGYLRTGCKNIDVSAFQYFNKYTRRGPVLGSYENGTVRVDNMLRGLNGLGEKVYDPHTGEEVKIVLAGDPISQTGWYMGDGSVGDDGPSDVKLVISYYIGDFAPGDTNCVTFAIMNQWDSNRMESLVKLKQLASTVKDHWLYEVERGFPEPPIEYVPVDTTTNDAEIPSSFIVSNNYPNPFNNVTNINLELQESGNIKVTLFNALGEVVREISEHSPTAGYKSIQLNGAGLSSGVYYYTVLFRGETKLGKFVLMK